MSVDNNTSSIKVTQFGHPARDLSLGETAESHLFSRVISSAQTIALEDKLTLLMKQESEWEGQSQLDTWNLDTPLPSLGPTVSDRERLFAHMLGATHVDGTSLKGNSSLVTVSYLKSVLLFFDQAKTGFTVDEINTLRNLHKIFDILIKQISFLRSNHNQKEIYEEALKTAKEIFVLKPNES